MQATQGAAGAAEVGVGHVRAQRLDGVGGVPDGQPVGHQHRAHLRAYTVGKGVCVFARGALAQDEGDFVLARLGIGQLDRVAFAAREVAREDQVCNAHVLGTGRGGRAPNRWLRAA